MRVLVTGAGGLIGRVLLQRLLGQGLAGRRAERIVAVDCCSAGICTTRSTSSRAVSKAEALGFEHDTTVERMVRRAFGRPSATPTEQSH